MKADNTKKKEYTEPQIEYIAFVYADVEATSEVENGGDSVGDGDDPWETE